jgi:hypothetical protein
LIFKALAPLEQADIFSFFGSLFSFLVGKIGLPLASLRALRERMQRSEAQS